MLLMHGARDVLLHSCTLLASSLYYQLVVVQLKVKNIRMHVSCKPVVRQQLGASTLQSRLLTLVAMHVPGSRPAIICSSSCRFVPPLHLWQGYLLVLLSLCFGSQLCMSLAVALPSFAPLAAGLSRLSSLVTLATSRLRSVVMSKLNIAFFVHEYRLTQQA